MSVPDDLQRRLTAWLDDQAPLHEPEGLLDAVTTDIARSGRTPSWAIPERWLPMQTRARLGTLPRAAILLVTLAMLGALLASLALGASGSPAPTFVLPPPFGPAGNGLIAHDGGADIWVMEPDGSNPKQLTSGPAMDFEPSWSPDGRLLAFWSVDIPGGSSNSSADPSSGTPSLVIIDAQGREHGRLAIPGRLTYEYTTPPSWSPDGQRLVIGYDEEASPHRAALATVTLDGMTLTPLATGTSPMWSPQGTWIAYRRLAKTQASVTTGVGIVHPDGGLDHQVTKVSGSGYAFSAPQWSMDERYLTFYTGSDENHDVWVAKADGTGEWPVADELVEEYWPSFSPDGSRVAIQRDMPGQNLAFNYLVSHPDGSDPVDIPSPVLLPALPGVWAPDGTRLLGIHQTAAKTIELYELDPTGVASPVVVPLDTDWVNLSWQRVAAPGSTSPAPAAR